MVAGMYLAQHLEDVNGLMAFTLDEARQWRNLHVQRLMNMRVGVCGTYLHLGGIVATSAARRIGRLAWCIF